MRLDSKEIELARKCMEFALEKGADKVRITLTKSLLNLVGVLNGEVDKVTHSLDRSLQLNLFVDGRYGTFSSNKFEKEGLEAFITEAITTVRMLEKDSFRNLPAPERQAKNATDGRELDLYDQEYENMTAERRRELALGSSKFSKDLISEEGEYSDSLFDSVTIDSNGLFARHTETSFEIGYEVTIEDRKGNRYSGYWWDSTPRLRDLKIDTCSSKAIERARAQIGPKGIRSGKYTVVIDSECASKVLTPVLNALGGFPLQQKNSFMDGTIGKKVFPENLTIMDLPHSKGESGARMYDSEGVATRETAIIEKGVVKEYFLNTYMAAKMGMEPTIEDSTRVKVLPTGGCRTREEILRRVGDCILVTGFNGGNSNSATGNFSYGIEGFLVKDGKIAYPVKEALMTGDFLTLWNNLIFAAEDARLCLPKLVPSIAFAGVDISA